MRRSPLAATLLALIWTGANAQKRAELSIESLPPVVVKTVPVSGDTAVDTSLAEIRVTFSKDMMTQEMWSWVIAYPGHFPEMTGEVHYLEDRRTCVAPVKLEPGKTYAIWLNSKTMTGFRDTANHPAVPYLLVFRTKK